MDPRSAGNQKFPRKKLTNLGIMCYNGYIRKGEAIMFDIFQQDDGLFQRLKELKAYYKQKDETEERKKLKTTDSILQRLYKIYPGM